MRPLLDYAGEHWTAKDLEENLVRPFTEIRNRNET